LAANEGAALASNLITNTLPDAISTIERAMIQLQKERLHAFATGA
jgi:hypothetical protein